MRSFTGNQNSWVVIWTIIYNILRPLFSSRASHYPPSPHFLSKPQERRNLDAVIQRNALHSRTAPFPFAKRHTSRIIR
ncbi:hypothetical protein WG66_007429 [Moniliophthora roreri]|nr:hypothetical protein WG66_007429 [Moniliophthora roreri]